MLLPRILYDCPTTFWLDAHYYLGLNDPAGPQCPLREEIRAIAAFRWTTPPIILIDDACMFDDTVSPPSYGPFWDTWCAKEQGYRREDYPRIEEIDALLPGYVRSLRTPEVFMYQKYVD